MYACSNTKKTKVVKPFLPKWTEMDTKWTKMDKNGQKMTEKNQNRQKMTKKESAKRLSGRYWRLVIPALSGYGKTPNLNMTGLSRLKAQTVDLIQANQRSRGLQYYLVACQTHGGTGLPHLDIILIYTRSVKNRQTWYDYLIKHGDLTRYRTVNMSILDYGRKQDPAPLGNLNTKRILLESKSRTDLYSMMEEAMIKTPFKFVARDWISRNSLWGSTGSGVYRDIRKIQDYQNSYCNDLLRKKPGIATITRQLIEKTLSPDELSTYDSWDGYQTIVDHINQISKWGYIRPHKTSNLLLVGPPNTGKTTLAKALEKWCSAYPLGAPGGWFPAYRDGTYSMLTWDQFNLSTYKYQNLLKLLEGRPMKLPQKGGHVPRADNQLIYMTSNLPLDYHIRRSTRDVSLWQIRRLNLSPRIIEVVIPEGRDLFLLLNLIHVSSK